MNRGALADIRATARRIDAEREAAAKETMRRIREHRQPRPPAVMPEVNVGDWIDVGGNWPLRVVKVNAKSVVTEGGSRWAAGEFEVVRL